MEVFINEFLAFLARFIYGKDRQHGKDSQQKSFLSMLTGANTENTDKTLLSFTALFMLLCSYYLLKPLRNASFLQEFDPNELPVFFLFVAFLSFLITKFFNHFSIKVPKEKLITITFCIVFLCKIIFYFLLEHDSNVPFTIPLFSWQFFLTAKTIIITFYIWAAVYFLLSIALMWACINSIFSSEEGKSAYGFICTGAVTGAFVGSWLTSHIVTKFQPLTVLPISAVILALSLAFILLAIGKANNDNQPLDDIDTPTISNTNPKTNRNANDKSAKNNASEQISDNTDDQHGKHKSMFYEFMALLTHKYLRAIGAIVFALAVFNTAFYFQTHKIIDGKMNRIFYDKHFKTLFEKEEFGITEQQDWFKFVYELKLLKNDEKRTEEITRQINLYSKSPEQAALFIQLFQESYQVYKKELNEKTTIFFADTNFYTNIAGILLLMFGSRPLFRILGIKAAVLLCPIFCLLSGSLLFFPIGLELVQLLMVIGSALNYSLNNATKELLYIPAGKEANFRFKPFIEGPIMRIGDAFTSVLKIVLGLIFASQTTADNWYVSLCLLIVVYWLWEGINVSRLYEKFTAQATDTGNEP